MAAYVLIFLGSFSLTVLTIWALCKLAPLVGLVDHPGGRKIHDGSTALVGGIGVVGGGVLMVLVWIAITGRYGHLVETLLQHRGFFIGAFILLVTGAIDDRKPLRALLKLAIQAVCCTLPVVLDGAVISDVGIPVGSATVVLGPLLWPFTILVMLTITNALNLIDGVDGLAGGIAFVVLLLMAKTIVTAGFHTAPYVVTLAGATAGFLFFNFPWRPRTRPIVFLGDSGSLMLGYTLACLAIEYSSLPNRLFKPSTGLWFFFIPVTDAVWLYLRRTWHTGRSFTPGRDHIHHLLMQRLTPGQTTWTLVMASAALTGGAYLAQRWGVVNWLMIAAWIAAFLLYGIFTHRAWRDAFSQTSATPQNATQDVHCAIPAEAALPDKESSVG